VVVPYSTWVVDASLVDQVIIAPVLVTDPAAMPESVGAVVSAAAAVAKV
jgi:hypothetical protein